MLAVAGWLALRAVRPEGTPVTEAWRTVRTSTQLGLVVLVGIVTTAVLLVEQLRSSGALSYYFFKYVSAIDLVLVTVIALAAAGLAVAVRPSWVPGGGEPLPALVPVLLSGLVVVGAPFLVTPTPTLPGLLDPGREGTAQLSPRSRDQLAGDLLAASAARRQIPVRVVYLATPPSTTVQPLFPARWIWALGSEWSLGADAVGEPLLEPVHSVEQAVPVARALLDNDDTLVVLVRPSAVDQVRAGIADPARGDRVRTWTTTAHP